MINVHYFASIREAVKKSGEQLELPAAVESVSDLLAHLSANDANFKAVVEGDRQILVAVNQTVVGFEHKLSATDEVAFFPPMTGG